MPARAGAHTTRLECHLPWRTAEDGIFPKRQPGQYPSVAVRKSLRQRFVSAVGLEGVLGRDSVEAVQANPVKAMVAADAEAAEYDPLRDGPLRYCGYANECGWVTSHPACTRALHAKTVQLCLTIHMPKVASVQATMSLTHRRDPFLSGFLARFRAPNP